MGRHYLHSAHPIGIPFYVDNDVTMVRKVTASKVDILFIPFDSNLFVIQPFFHFPSIEGDTMS